jgi:hypothetical protein
VSERNGRGRVYTCVRVGGGRFPLGRKQYKDEALNVPLPPTDPPPPHPVCKGGYEKIEVPVKAASPREETKSRIRSNGGTGKWCNAKRSEILRWRQWEEEDNSTAWVRAHGGAREGGAEDVAGGGERSRRLLVGLGQGRRGGGALHNVMGP